MNEIDGERLRNYLSARHEVATAYLFGSLVSGRLRARDIDIAILMGSDIDPAVYGSLKLSILTDLIKLLSCDKVDLVILNEAPPLLCHEVLKRGIVLFSKDEPMRLKFTVSAVRRYLDTIHLRKVQDMVLHERIRRGDFGYFKGSRKYSIEKIRQSAPDSSAIE